jgi:putative peptidoglycan lipid II flippase
MLFQRGEFDAVAAHETARALAWQGGAIFTVSAVRQLVPAFHALGDTRTPVVVSGLDLLVFIALAVTLRGPFGHVGVSMAVAGSSAVQMVLLLIGLKWRMGTVRGGELFASVARTGAASVVAGAAAWGAARLLQDLGSGPIARVVPGALGALVFVALYAVLVWGLGAREVDELAAPIRRRFGRRRADSSG